MSVNCPITICGEVFRTKKSLIERVRKILWHYKPGVAGVHLEPRDFAFVLDLLRYHHNGDEKIGPGAVAIVVMKDDMGSQGFRVVRSDGKIVPFSYQTCISRKTDGADFKNACRREILDQVLDAKDRAFAGLTKISCPITGADITSSTCHVDHEPPLTFEWLLSTFVTENKIDMATIKVFNSGVGDKRLIDRALATKWQDFHRQRARLRVVSIEANLSIIRRATK